MNYKFILSATLTFIPYTALWFFWHNNLFPHVYYTLDYFRTIASQNIWYMNFANALLVYGFVYFYWVRTPVSKIVNVILWGVYYNISVTGFFSFMLLGIMDEWNLYILIFDLLWALVGGILCGILVFFLRKKIAPNSIESD